MRVVRVEIHRRTAPTGKGQHKSKLAEWSWHAIARNGRKLGWTGEAHVKRAHCIAALVAVVDPWERGIPVVEVDKAGKRTALLCMGGTQVIQDDYTSA